MSLIGEKYRELRQEQGITLTQAAQGICASSNLSRFENGHINLEFNKVLALINQIHITPDEFIGHAQIKQKDVIPQEIYDALKDEDTQQIKKLTLKYLDLYHNERYTHHLFLAVIMSNHYLLIKNENILPYRDKVSLYNYLSKINLWSNYNLIFFSNSVFMIDPNKIYALSMHILSNQTLSKENNYDDTLSTLVGVLNDAVIALIFHKDLKHARKLLHSLDQVKLPLYFDFFKLAINFEKKCVRYMKDGNDEPILEFIQNTIDLGMNAAADTFLDVFKRVKDIKRSK